jgi:hypothetical protein
MTVPPSIRGKKLIARELPRNPPNDWERANKLEVMYWTSKLIDAEDARRKAEREYQQILLHLRGVMKKGD